MLSSLSILQIQRELIVAFIYFFMSFLLIVVEIMQQKKSIMTSLFSSHIDFFGIAYFDSFYFILLSLKSPKQIVHDMQLQTSYNPHQY